MIFTVLKLAWRYRTAVTIGATVLGLLGATGYFYLKGRADCHSAAEVRTLERVISKKEELNEIRNRHYDAAVAARRLRDRTF